MTGLFKEQLDKIRQRRIQKNYDAEKPPIFSLSPIFTPLTYGQRNLLFYLIRASKKDSSQGEFQWCVETVPAGVPPMHFIVGIKPVDRKTRMFDLNSPMYQEKDWKMVYRNGQMKTLEDAGYISISPFLEHIVDTKNNKEEKWVHFCLNQKAYDYYRFMNNSAIRRLGHILWENSEKHFVTVLISIISAVAGAVIIFLLIG